VQVSFADFDRLQNNMQQATDDILRLQAHVTALEGGAPLPADQSIAPQPQPTETCEAYMMRHAPKPAAEPDTAALPDISTGWVGGGRN
jgi:hypothetical protein